MESTVNERDMIEPESSSVIDFTNTEIAFSNKSDQELKKMVWLFRLMNKQKLVDWGSKLGMWAIKLRLPFSEGIIRNTIFQQFCGGENLLDCQEAIDKLYKYNTLTMLDYGAEGKSTDEELDAVMEETIKAIEFAASNNSVPVVSSKVTGLVDNNILIKIQENQPLNSGEQSEYDAMVERVNKICERASELGVGVFIDAEESWMQDPIDELVEEMMSKYNINHVAVYSTYQMYRHDKLDQLKRDHQKALAGGYLLGAKIVRGAYMEKERERAKEKGYRDPIQPNKAATDRDFDEAISYCVKNYETIASCCASHNLESNKKQAQLICKLKLPKDHMHLNFCQLYGMSDHITFNLAEAGFNVAKYVPYGPIREVIPYLIRRAEENASVKGEMSRELSLIESEAKRRGLG